MATTYLPGAVRPANPTRAPSTLSRRMLLGAAALAIPLAGAAALPISTSARHEWDHLVAQFQRADARMKALGVKHGAAEDAFFTAKGSLGDRPQPPKIEYPRPISQMTIDELRELKAPADEQERFTAAFAKWHAETEAARQRTMGDIEERWAAALDEQAVAVRAVFAHPAPDTAALLFKLDLIESEYRGFDIDAGATKQVFKDVRRFVCGEA